MEEKYQQDYPNSHYLSNINTLNGTNQHITLNRLPTLGEILSNKTKSPVDIFTFYKYMKLVNKVEYLDFWFDLVNHLNLCKHYVKGLRNLLLKQRASFKTEDHHKSLSSSVLLDMIINDEILKDDDSNRLSQFLRGDLNVTDPKLADLINQYETETDNNRDSKASMGSSIPLMNSPNQQYQDNFRPPSGFSSIGEKRVSSNSRLIEDDLVDNKLEGAQTGDYTQIHTPGQRQSSINPSLLEKLAKSSPHDSSNSGSFITRNHLKESTQNLLLKYFVEDAEKYLNLPSNLNNLIIRSIEVDGRDDPDIFNHVKSYVFNIIENEHLPNFLNTVAIKNLNSNTMRIIVGLLAIFVGFWIGYVLIFLNYKKAIRIPVLVPFFIGFYCIMSAIYLIDPILVWLKRGESFENSKRFVKLEEPFIFRLLVKRSIWVMFLILLCTAILTVIFCLVPGRRL